MSTETIPTRPLEGPPVWHGRDLRAKSDWIRILGPRDLDRLRRGLQTVRHRKFQEISREDFPDAADLVDSLRAELLRGRGFVLVRGIDLDEFSVEDAARLFWGLGAHVGPALPQNRKGHLIGHVKDMGFHADDPNVRLYQTTERQGFHTDSCDVVGLFCLSAARRGGISSLASTWTAFNVMLHRRPDLVGALFEPIWTDHRGEHPPGSNPWFSIPVLSWHRRRILGLYQRRYIESAQRFPEVPRLQDRQKKALDLFDEVLEEVALPMELEPGDIQFVHNHQILHDRTAFEDDPKKPRHLLRLWLAPRDGWPLPPPFSERFGSLVPGERGGIRMSGLVPAVTLTP
jgi:hypothetical protein